MKKYNSPETQVLQLENNINLMGSEGVSSNTENGVKLGSLKQSGIAGIAWVKG
ncbi:MAG: hypothetical protein MJZ75_00530 [Paludibacteraceae bacterium]|nr:hypothetical protein [Paludibacteraceae bacterium]